MKYTFIHYPSFYQGAWPIAILTGAVAVALYIANYVLLGIFAALIGIAGIWIWKQRCQLKVLVNSYGIRLKVWRYKSFYAWDTIENIEDFDLGLHLFVRNRKVNPVIIPAFDKTTDAYEKLARTLRSFCQQHHIPCKGL